MFTITIWEVSAFWVVSICSMRMVGDCLNVDFCKQMFICRLWFWQFHFVILEEMYLHTSKAFLILRIPDLTSIPEFSQANPPVKEKQPLKIEIF